MTLHPLHCWTSERVAQHASLVNAGPSPSRAGRLHNTASPKPTKRPAHKFHGLHAAKRSHTAEAEEQPTTSGRHCLECGQELELISCLPKRPTDGLPPLLFLHGAMHGAWCYKENFLPFFAARGYPAYAMSLRGHGGSDFVEGETGGLTQHVEDIKSVVRSLERPPVLIAHSLGGLLAQRYLSDNLENSDGTPELAGVAFLAVPALSATLSPSFEWMRQLQGVMHGLKIIWWMNAMPKERRGLVRELFFSDDISAEAFGRYHRKIREQRSLLPVDGRELMEYKAVVDRTAAALREQRVPVHVVAAGADRMLMRCQVDALGDMFGCDVACVPGVGHDLMLDTRWLSTAELLDDWFEELADRRRNP